MADSQKETTMIIGTPTELKNHEYRVGVTPAAAHALASDGHTVWVQHNAGLRAGFSDEDYQRAGAKIAASAAQIYEAAELIIKVKEPQPEEYPRVRAGQILFCYQHFAPAPKLAAAMLESHASCVAFETVSDAGGGLPLLAPMSRIAGRLAPQMGAYALQMANGGSGVLLGGVAGVPAAKVVVIGAGSVGSHATQIAVGMGADVTVFDLSSERLDALDRHYQGRIKTAINDPLTLKEHVIQSDLVIGATLLPGQLAKKLIDREMLAAMRPGSALVDVAIDQGGISETSHPTTHAEPLYIEEGVVHYCVSNMPAAVARTATMALSQAILPHARAIARLGLHEAIGRDSGLSKGLQIHAGKVRHAALAADLGLDFSPL
jgi:alanine dehydrogenase